MSIHLIDSDIFGSAWTTPVLRDLLNDQGRLAGWLEVIVALAEAQSEVGIVPQEVLPEIKRVCQPETIDIQALGKAYERTGHSMLGLIELLESEADDSARPWIYYGATVQDITDTAMSITLKKVWSLFFADLRETELSILELAKRHRDTPMIGRTHGQAGLPITFGFKAAGWAAEVRRHLTRLKEVHPRLGVAQLGGGVGSMSAFGEKARPLIQAFAEKTGLAAPDIAWTSARDTRAEFLQLLSGVASTVDKIAHEVYTLQRNEIGELREGRADGQVGSITMPHKRNPELAEHIGTLARLVRKHSEILSESLVHDHERDGRSWKVEWGVLGPALAMSGAMLEHGKKLLAGLEVDQDAMLANVKNVEDQICSEALMQALASKVGKRKAHEWVQAASLAGVDQPFGEAIRESSDIMGCLEEEEVSAILDFRAHLGDCPDAVDRVVASCEAERLQDPS